MQIGAYSFEHGHTQKVRFDVTADVLRVTDQSGGHAPCLSYDIIMDGIRTIVARGHVQLSEALAEQVAAHVLEDPRVMRVMVRVEKLELGPGGVGVEIERKRAKQQTSALRPVRCPRSDATLARPRQERPSLREASRRQARRQHGRRGRDGRVDRRAGGLASLPLVIVPGGGPFADQVRDAQKRHEFSDKPPTPWRSWPWTSSATSSSTATADLFRRDHCRTWSARCRTGKFLSGCLRSLAIPASDIPASWDITSDSLAAWLAGSSARMRCCSSSRPASSHPPMMSPA